MLRGGLSQTSSTIKDSQKRKDFNLNNESIVKYVLRVQKQNVNKEK
jgi:hypothetical protein